MTSPFPYHRYDILFVGGGLANTLAAYRLTQFRPDFNILVLEKGESLGGNHTWSYQQGDLTARQRSWLSPFVTRAWQTHQVFFPRLKRQIPIPYFSIKSEDFHKEAMLTLKDRVRLNAPVKTLKSTGVILESGEELESLCVVDGRGWTDQAAIPAGYQKFFGMDLTLNAPHGLTDPILMDVQVPQKDGFRFFYVLPWNERSLLIEDTRYSNGPDINPDEYRKEIIGYAEKRGWAVQSVIREEASALPIPLEGVLPQWEPDIPRLGTAGGFFHSTTGYSLPNAVRMAEAFVTLARYDGPSVYKWARAQAGAHWEKESFHRFLNRMMFKAAKPEERFKILQKFYTHSDDLITRFYAGEMKGFDQVRMLTGKPPVSIARALKCLF